MPSHNPRPPRTPPQSGSGQSRVLIKPPYPMLAKTGTLANLAGAVANGYVIEPKIDGIRCIVIVGSPEGSGVQLYNRQLRNITAAFPDACAQIRGAFERSRADALFSNTPLVLDGELYVTGPDGVPNFQLVQHRANRLRDVDDAAKAYPAMFHVFDLLCWGKEIMHWTLRDRRRVLEELLPTLIIPTYTQGEADDAARSLTGEGLMLKHSASTYVPAHRSPSWIKVKWLREIECYVGGVTHGYGKREAYFGGLLVGVFKPEDREGRGRLGYIGTVGTGFTDAALEDLSADLSKLRTTDNPFDAHDAGWDLAYYTRPVMRVRVRFSEYTRDGIMRFPRFVGMA